MPILFGISPLILALQAGNSTLPPNVHFSGAFVML
jgi:hypothetical protein